MGLPSLSWVDQVPLYQHDSDTQSSTMNQPLQALIDRTDYLKSYLEQVSANSRLIIACNRLSSDTAKGDAIYFNTETDQYEPALAKWDDEYADDGSLQPAPSAVMLGFVLQKTTANSGYIFLYGELEDASFVTSLLGADPDPGLYYLSSLEAGKVTLDEPPIRVPCLFYVGQDRCVALEHKAWWPNHIHKNFELEESWYTADPPDPRFEGMTIPAGALFGYDIASDTELSSLFSIVPGAVTVIGDGTILGTDKVVVNDDNIWWMDNASLPTAYELWVYAAIPYSYGEPILRGAQTNKPEELTVTAEQGMLTIDPADWAQEGATANSRTCISGIAGRKYTKSEQISQVLEGPGVTVTVDSEGKATVSASQQVEALIDADLTNLDNAVESSDGSFVYFTLPADRDASFTGVCAIPKFDGTATIHAAAFAVRRGIFGATVGSPITFPELTVDMTFVPTAKGEPYVDISSPSTLATSLAGESTVQERLYYQESPEVGGRIEVESEGQLFVKISIAAGNYDKDIFRYGIILYTS